MRVQAYRGTVKARASGLTLHDYTCHGTSVHPYQFSSSSILLCLCTDVPKVMVLDDASCTKRGGAR